MTQFDARLSAYSPTVLSVFRVIVGLLFLLEGTSKLFGWPAPYQAPVGAWPAWWAGLIEVVVGLLVTVGFFTRIAAFIGSGEMAVAYLWMHWPGKGGASFWPILNGGELPLLFCFSLLLLATTGGGLYAVDARRRVRTAPRTRTTTRTSRWRRG